MLNHWERYAVAFTICLSWMSGMMGFPVHTGWQCRGQCYGANGGVRHVAYRGRIIYIFGNILVRFTSVRQLPILYSKSDVQAVKIKFA